MTSKHLHSSMIKKDIEFADVIVLKLTTRNLAQGFCRKMSLLLLNFGEFPLIMYSLEGKFEDLMLKITYQLCYGYYKVWYHVEWIRQYVLYIK